jgi:hypothetical protein
MEAGLRANISQEQSRDFRVTASDLIRRPKCITTLDIMLCTHQFPGRGTAPSGIALTCDTVGFRCTRVLTSHSLALTCSTSCVESSHLFVLYTYFETYQSV